MREAEREKDKREREREEDRELKREVGRRDADPHLSLGDHFSHILDHQSAPRHVFQSPQAPAHGALLAKVIHGEQEECTSDLKGLDLHVLARGELPVAAALVGDPAE
jgi:hypothetical protein